MDEDDDEDLVRFESCSSSSLLSWRRRDTGGGEPDEDLSSRWRLEDEDDFEVFDEWWLPCLSRLSFLDEEETVSIVGLCCGRESD